MPDQLCACCVNQVADLLLQLVRAAAVSRRRADIMQPGPVDFQEGSDNQPVYDFPAILVG